MSEHLETPSHGNGKIKRGGKNNGQGRKKGSTPIALRKLMSQAAVMAANGCTQVQIAETVGRAVDTIKDWYAIPEFKQMVDDQIEAARKKILEEGIADRVERVKRLGERWNGVDSVFKARAADPLHQSCPGWDTGLLVHEQKSLGSGDLATVIDVYRVDVGTIKEERELAKQAAQELGQWTEKTQTSFDLSNLTDEDLEALERIQSKLTKP